MGIFSHKEQESQEEEFCMGIFGHKEQESQEEELSMGIFSHKEQESQEEGIWGFAPVLKPSCISCTTC